MTPPAYLFDSPVQKLRAGDRILSSSSAPELHLRTVLYVRSARATATGAPTPYGPVVVITTPVEGETLEEEGGTSLPWGSRVRIERVPEPRDEYRVSALEPLEGAELEVQVVVGLTIERKDFPEAFGTATAPTAGATISELLSRTEGAILEAAARDGEVISAWWLAGGRQVETPAEHSAREAADLFADHEVRLRPAGSDAGETCPTCGGVISWANHLPPSSSGRPARCMVTAGHRLRSVGQ